MDFDSLQMSKKVALQKCFFGHLQPIKIHPIYLGLLRWGRPLDGEGTDADCVDGDDEEDCLSCRGVNAFLCLRERTCLAATMLCNGIKNCADGSDLGRVQDQAGDHLGEHFNPQVHGVICDP